MNDSIDKKEISATLSVGIAAQLLCSIISSEGMWYDESKYSEMVLKARKLRDELLEQEKLL